MDFSEREIDELENPENWDFDSIQIQPPVKNPRAVISVALTRSEFDQVASAARQRGISLTEFIKDASLRASGSPGAAPHNHSGAENGITVSDTERAQSHTRLND